MKNYYNVIYKVSENTWSANIAHAESEEAVQEYYKRKSTTICISLVSKGDVEVAKKKGMPIVEIGVTEI